MSYMCTTTNRVMLVWHFIFLNVIVCCVDVLIYYDYYFISTSDLQPSIAVANQLLSTHE